MEFQCEGFLHSRWPRKQRDVVQTRIGDTPASDTEVPERDQRQDEQFCHASAMLLRAKAQLAIRGVVDGQGYEAWRLLCARYERRHSANNMGLLQAILIVMVTVGLIVLIDT